MTPTAGERKSKKKSARARSKSARVLCDANRVPAPNRLLRQSCLFLRPCFHSFCLSFCFFFSSLARSSCAEIKSAFFSFFFLLLMKERCSSEGRYGAAIWHFEQKKERHRYGLIFERTFTFTSARTRARVVLSHHHQRRPLSLLALNISTIY